MSSSQIGTQIGVFLCIKEDTQGTQQENASIGIAKLWHENGKLCKRSTSICFNLFYFAIFRGKAAPQFDSSTLQSGAILVPRRSRGGAATGTMALTLALLLSSLRGSRCARGNRSKKKKELLGALAQSQRHCHHQHQRC